MLGFRALSRNRQRIISVFCNHSSHPDPPHPYFDLAIASDARFGPFLSQSVLIARISPPICPGVGAFNVSLRQFVVDFSSRGGNVFRQKVAVTHQCSCFRNMESLQTVVYRDGRAFHPHRVQSDALRQQHFEGIGIAGGRALFPPVADHKDNLPVVPAALRKIAGAIRMASFITRATLGGV